MALETSKTVTNAYSLNNTDYINFKQAAANNQPLMAMQFISSVFDELYSELKSLRAEVEELKSSGASETKKTAAKKATAKRTTSKASAKSADSSDSDSKSDS